jgi:hypothetical protein
VGEAVISDSSAEVDPMGLVDECPISSGTLGNWYKRIAAGHPKASAIADADETVLTLLY